MALLHALSQSYIYSGLGASQSRSQDDPCHQPIRKPGMTLEGGGQYTVNTFKILTLTSFNNKDWLGPRQSLLITAIQSPNHSVVAHVVD